MLTDYLRAHARDAAVADDLFQEVFLTAWRRFGDYDRSRPLAPWLRGIARNLLKDARRSHARRVRLLGEAADAAVGADLDHVHGSRGEGGHRDHLAAVADCVDALPAKARQLIRGRYRDGFDAAELADRAGLSHAAVRKRLQRAREAVADCVARKLDLVPSSPAPTP